MLKKLLALGLAIALTGCGTQARIAPTSAPMASPMRAMSQPASAPIDEEAYAAVGVDEARALVRGAKYARNWNPSQDEQHLADMAGNKIKLEGVLDVRQDESILSTTVEAILVPPQGQTIPVLVKEYKTRRLARALALKLPDQQHVTVYLTVQYLPRVFDFHPFRLDAVKLKDGTVVKF